MSCLLTEMDGLEQSKDILVMAATNRPELLDSAILRPGRLDLLLFVGPPDQESRFQILQIQTKETPLDEDVDLTMIAKETELFSGVQTVTLHRVLIVVAGSELGALCSEATMCSLRENIDGASKVGMKHFEQALSGIETAISIETIEMYKKWGQRNKKL